MAADEPATEIVVTGTLIRGITPTGANVVKMSSEDITAIGSANSNQLLSKIPQVTNAFNQIPSVNIGGPAVTISRPSLRNLSAVGGSTTLVLMDGHRNVNAGIIQTSPDPDVIPVSVLERIDVVPDGGSSIYGSDAVGGVINFVTKKRFDGFDANAHYGIADKYNSFDANITVGKDWTSGSAYISYAYAQHDPIFGRDRGYVRQVTPNSGFCAPGTVTVTRGGVPTTYAIPGRVAGTVSQCDFTDNLSIYPREKRNSVFGSLTQEISDSVNFDIKGFYTRRKTTNYVDWNKTGGFSSRAQTGTISSTNPYYVPINDAVNGADPGSQSVQFSYAGVFDNRQATSLDEYQITPTLTAQIGAGWQVRAIGTYGKSVTEAHGGTIDSTAQTNALAGTTFATALNPYNLAATNPAVLAGIYRDDFGRATQTLIDGRIIVDGSPLALPGGEVRAAVGVEASREGFDGAFGAVPAGQESLAPSAKAHRNVASIFAELSVPIVGSANAGSFAHSLTLSLSGRYDHYSDFGGTFNPKVGATWEPANWIAIRGNWGKSFNAPSLADTGGAADTRAQIIGVSPFLDPADPFFPNFFRPTILLAGGNPNLKPQKARSISIGTDIKPTIVPGLQISATYWNIDLRDQIAIVPFFSPAAYLPAYSSFVTKSPTLAQLTAAVGSLRLDGAGSLASLYAAGSPYVLMDARRQNLGHVKVEGIDFNVSYRHATSFGAVNASVAGTYTLKRDIQAVAGTPFVNDLAQPGNSRFSFIATLGAVIGKFEANASLNHTQGYNISPSITTSTFGTQSHVNSFNTVDLYLSYDLAVGGILKQTSLTLNVNNIFNRSPSFYNQDNGYPDTAMGTVGRFIQFGFRKKF